MTNRERPHLLVVEDDLAVRDVVRRYLEQEEYDVTVQPLHVAALPLPVDEAGIAAVRRHREAVAAAEVLPVRVLDAARRARRPHQ